MLPVLEWFSIRGWNRIMKQPLTSIDRLREAMLLYDRAYELALKDYFTSDFVCSVCKEDRPCKACIKKHLETLRLKTLERPQFDDQSIA